MDSRNYPKRAIQVTLIRQEPEKVIITNEENRKRTNLDLQL